MAHDPEVRAQAMGALLEGQAVSKVAEEYRIPDSTVRRWKREARERAGHTEDVGALLLDYVRENLATLRAQAEFFRNEDWLKKQSAADLAVLHGVATDKVVRLLECMEGGPVDG